jgi:hypothetical protein
VESFRFSSCLYGRRPHCTSFNSLILSKDGGLTSMKRWYFNVLRDVGGVTNGLIRLQRNIVICSALSKFILSACKALLSALSSLSFARITCLSLSRIKGFSQTMQASSSALAIEVLLTHMSSSYFNFFLVILDASTNNLPASFTTAQTSSNRSQPEATRPLIPHYKELKQP